MRSGYIVFVEYRIAVESRVDYLEWISRHREANVMIYEGEEQANLFVEVWEAQTKDAAEAIKEQRQAGQSVWSEVTQWIEGGSAKMHVWLFRPLTAGS